MGIAQWLEKHPKVTKVVYPGTSHPQKALADKYHSNDMHGSMLWFELDGGAPAGIQLMNNIERPWSLCENLGAVESIITACAVMMHANMRLLTVSRSGLRMALSGPAVASRTKMILFV